MPIATYHPTSAVQHYAQELAQYTLRQYSSAAASLDDIKWERLERLPGSHSRNLKLGKPVTISSSQ